LAVALVETGRLEEAEGILQEAIESGRAIGVSG
jgi:pentatricopeptide repeat protein